MPRIRFFRGSGGRLRLLHKAKNTLKLRKNTKYIRIPQNSSRDRPSLRRIITTKSARTDLGTPTLAKDRFSHLVKEQPNDIAFAADLPPGIVSVAALENLSEDGLERLFGVTKALMENKGHLAMEPRDIGFAYAIPVRIGVL